MISQARGTHNKLGEGKGRLGQVRIACQIAISVTETSRKQVRCFTRTPPSKLGNKGTFMLKQYPFSLGDSGLPSILQVKQIGTLCCIYIKLCLHWRRLYNNAGNSDTHYLLALATLDGTTEIEIILISKVSKEGDIVMRYRGHFRVQISPM